MVAGPGDRLSAPRALGTRVLAASLALLVAFLGLTFLGLDLAFRRAAEQALADSMSPHSFKILLDMRCQA